LFLSQKDALEWKEVQQAVSRRVLHRNWVRTFV
jgi:hypothetical protein